MIELNPQILTRDGKPEFAVLPYEEFEQLKTTLEDAEDLLALESTRRQDAGKPTTTLEELRRRFGMTD